MAEATGSVNIFRNVLRCLLFICRLNQFPITTIDTVFERDFDRRNFRYVSQMPVRESHHLQADFRDIEPKLQGYFFSHAQKGRVGVYQGFDFDRLVPK